MTQINTGIIPFLKICVVYVLTKKESNEIRLEKDGESFLFSKK